MQPIAKALADFVVPQEYGQTEDEKLDIGQCIGGALLNKIISDLFASSNESETVHRLGERHARKLGIKSLDRHVRTRLYFTSESHLHSVLNVLRFRGKQIRARSPPEEFLVKLSEIPELNYLTHVVFRLFEVTDSQGGKSFKLRILMSEGVTELDAGTLKVGVKKDEDEEEVVSTVHVANQLPPASPLVPLWLDLSLEEAIGIMNTEEDDLVSLASSVGGGSTESKGSSVGGEGLRRSALYDKSTSPKKMGRSQFSKDYSQMDLNKMLRHSS